MQQSIHELLPEMAWQAGVLYRLDAITELLQSIEASLFNKLEVPPSINLDIPDDVDWDSTDITDSDMSDIGYV